VTPGRHVLTVVACGAGPAAAISTCVKLAQDRDWTIQVTATPAALDFFDAAAIANQTGSPFAASTPSPARPGPSSPTPSSSPRPPTTPSTNGLTASATPTPSASSPRAPASASRPSSCPSSTPPWPTAPRSVAAWSPCAPKA
jgi:hypothetical protein